MQEILQNMQTLKSFFDTFTSNLTIYVKLDLFDKHHISNLTLSFHFCLYIETCRSRRPNGISQLCSSNFMEFCRIGGLKSKNNNKQNKTNKKLQQMTVSELSK